MAEDNQPSTEAFLAAYDEFSEAIYRHCYYRVSKKEVAEDLMQDVFMKLWDYLKEGNTVENMKAFLYHIAHNLIVNYYKKKKSLSLDQMQEEGFDPASSSDVGIDAFTPETVAQYLSQLAPEDRELLIMRYVDDMTPGEIGDVLEVTENVVSVRLHRAIKKLRTLLGDG